MFPVHSFVFILIVLSELTFIFSYVGQTATVVEPNINQNGKENKILNNLVSSISEPAGAAFSATSSLIDRVRSLPRKLKTLTSSSVESLLLEMTMPSNSFLEESDVQQLLEMIENICNDFAMDGKSCKLDPGKLSLLKANSVQEEICYDLIIRKLSSKFKERDWRIGGKSLHIIHRLIGESKNTIKNKQYFCSSYLEKFDLISDNIDSHISVRINNLEVHVSAKSLDERDVQRKWIRSYTEYLQTFSELVCRSGGSYMSDSMVMKGPVHALRLYNLYFAAAQTLIEDTLALKHPNSCSLAEVMSNASVDLVSTDVLNSMAQLQELMTATTVPNSLHIGSITEMQHVSTDLTAALSNIASLTRNKELSNIPAWLNDLTSMESSKV